MTTTNENQTNNRQGTGNTGVGNVLFLLALSGFNACLMNISGNMVLTNNHNIHMTYTTNQYITTYI